MPQEKDDIKALNTKDSVMTAEGRKVLPKEDTVVYSTGSGKHLGEAGTKHVVHKALVEKLVASGQVSEEPVSRKKEVKLTKNELTALTRRLGHEPSDEEIAEAVKEKEDEL